MDEADQIPSSSCSYELIGVVSAGGSPHGLKLLQPPLLRWRDTHGAQTAEPLAISPSECSMLSAQGECEQFVAGPWTQTPPPGVYPTAVPRSSEGCGIRRVTLSLSLSLSLFLFLFLASSLHSG